MTRPALPRSELSHPASREMDRMSAEDLARLFEGTTRELFAALLAPRLLEEAEGLKERLGRDPPSLLLLAGAGSSGRIARFLSRRHREGLERRGIRLLSWIAGGLPALVSPVEGAEDDGDGARREVGALLEAEPSFFLGISCGLSAPCVAAGLSEALRLGRGAALFGVNPPSEASREAPGSSEESFAALISSLRQRGDAWCLIPDTGPEVLTGSSRLKGGSAAWVLLDALLSSLAGEGGTIEAGIRRWEASLSWPGPELPGWIAEAGESLRRGGGVQVLGRGEPGLAALLDASECLPTFGASKEQWRAWIQGGWSAFLDPGEVGGRAPLSLEDFEGEPLQVLDRDDPVFLAGLEEPPPWLSGRKVHPLPCRDFLSSKLLLNALSTSAFVRAGKVYGNLMLDLLPSNTKLLKRACRILEDLTGALPGPAFRSLLAALHGVESPPAELFRNPIELHLGKARPGVVPLALLHLRGMSLEEGRKVLEEEPVLKLALEKHLHDS